jgi:hypothetical protein
MNFFDKKYNLSRFVALCSLLFSLVFCKYEFKITRLNQNQPVISSLNSENSYGASVFDYNYNAAFYPENEKLESGLLVRCQNKRDENIYNVAPSVITYA